MGLAASFIATTAVGCKEGNVPNGGDDYHSPATLSQSGDGTCSYTPSYGCPAGVSCNPPGQLGAECPSDLRDGGPPSDPFAVERSGWLRIKETVGGYQGNCYFVPDYFCPRPDQKTPGACERPESQRLSCRMMPASAAETGADAGPPLPEGGQPGWHHVESFTAKRAGGLCVRYPAFWCDPGCELPPGDKVDCTTGEVIAKGASSVVAVEPTATIATSSSAVANAGPLNPRDAQNRVIHAAWSGEGCFVYLPFPPLRAGEDRPPGSAPPRETVPCPPIMSTPTFQQCRGGTVTRASDQCSCFVGGNPPPPPRPVPCP
jgi:hypothetical protein